MFKLIAYLLAIFSLYRKQLFLLFLSFLVAMLLIPLVRQTDPMRIVPVAFGPGGSAQSTAVPTRLGQTFSSLAELKTVEMGGGFVPTGTFGNSWPATVGEILLANDKVTFTRQNGISHTYKGFGGYRLKVVRLFSAKGEEVIVVFRSQLKN